MVQLVFGVMNNNHGELLFLIILMIRIKRKMKEHQGVFRGLNHLILFSNNDSSTHLTSVNNKVIPVTIVSWSCTDRRVATAYENGLIKIWEPNHGTFLNELKVI